jgi:hypothetical protein
MLIFDSPSLKIYVFVDALTTGKGGVLNFELDVDPSSPGRGGKQSFMKVPSPNSDALGREMKKFPSGRNDAAFPVRNESTRGVSLNPTGGQTYASTSSLQSTAPDDVFINSLRQDKKSR